MKKLLSAIAISISTIMTASSAMAAPEHTPNAPQKNQKNPHKIQQQSHQTHTSQQHANTHQANHQLAAQVKKAQQHNWKAGNKYPSEYRGAGYKVDYKHDKKLNKPSKNQQWYKADNKYVLVDTATYAIIKVLGL